MWIGYRSAIMSVAGCTFRDTIITTAYATAMSISSTEPPEPLPQRDDSKPSLQFGWQILSLPSFPCPFLVARPISPPLSPFASSPINFVPSITFPPHLGT